MALSPTRVAYRHMTRLAAPPDLREVMNTLRNLAELDENLSEYEDYVQSKFAAATTLNPEVSSQLDALNKAITGTQKAQEALKAAQAIVELFPDDKTAPRAVQAAEVMIGRFQRHAEEARKIVRRIAKKEMPADIKKAAAALKRALQRRLVNPNDLQEIPWVGKPFVRGEIAAYQVFLVAKVPGRDKLQGVMLEQRLYTSEARYGDPGVKFSTGQMGSFLNAKPFKLQDAVAAFVENMRGWSGIQGEEAATKGREQVAKQIASALSSWQRSMGSYGSDDVEVGRGGLTVRGGIRRDTRWEQHSEWDYDDGVSEEGGKLRKSLEQALRSQMQAIKHIDVSYGEKGWWSVYITLK